MSPEAHARPRSARLVSTGSFLPEQEVSNDALRRRFSGVAGLETFVDDMEEGTAIRSRRRAPDDWSTSDLALPAARQALERAGRRPEDVDLLILCTDTPDFPTPATSTVLQHKLGAHHAGTFDVACACASFPTGLTTAAGWIAVNPSIQTVLVVGAYLMSRHADPADPTIFFYGDGAGAAVLEPSEEPGFVSAAAHADGSYAERWGIFAGGTAEPASHDAVDGGRTKVRLLERYPPEINNEGWPRIVRELARNGDFDVADIDLALFTQVRKPSIELVMSELGLPMERTHTIMEQWGYTGSACLAMALDDGLQKGKAAAGDLLVLVGSGVGYNQAGTAFRL